MYFEILRSRASGKFVLNSLCGYKFRAMRVQIRKIIKFHVRTRPELKGALFFWLRAMFKIIWLVEWPPLGSEGLLLEQYFSQRGKIVKMKGGKYFVFRSFMFCS